MADLLAERRVAARRVQLVPEALYVRGEQDNGGELLALHEGTEGRVWRDGALVASRWWPAPPTEADWRGFLRAAGLPAPGATPAPIPSAPAARPWGAQRTRRRTALQLSGAAALLPGIVIGAGLIFSTVASVQLGNTLRSYLDVWQAQRASEQLDTPLKQILAAREAADRNLVAIDQLIALRPGRPAIALIAEVGRLLPAGDARIRHWSQPTPDRLELTLSLPNADPQALVERWEASPFFDDVTTDALGRGGEIVIRANVVPAAAALAQ